MLLVMFLFSNMNSSDSNSRSKDIIKSGVVIVNKTFNLYINDNDINNFVNKFNYPFRKICHFSEYFILSVLLVFSLRFLDISIIKSIIITVLFCFIFSISDEIHQMFVVGRSPLFTDCIIDTLGSIFFCLIYYFRTKKLS